MRPVLKRAHKKETAHYSRLGLLSTRSKSRGLPKTFLRQGREGAYRKVK